MLLYNGPGWNKLWWSKMIHAQEWLTLEKIDLKEEKNVFFFTVVRWLSADPQNDRVKSYRTHLHNWSKISRKKTRIKDAKKWISFAWKHDPTVCILQPPLLFTSIQFLFVSWLIGKLISSTNLSENLNCRIIQDP